MGVYYTLQYQYIYHDGIGVQLQPDTDHQWCSRVDGTASDEVDEEQRRSTLSVNLVTCRTINTTMHHWWSSFPHCSDKNVEQSAVGRDIITNTVIIQIQTENLFVFFIISWPVIHFYCTVQWLHCLCTIHLSYNYICMRVRVCVCVCCSLMSVLAMLRNGGMLRQTWWTLLVVVTRRRSCVRGFISFSHRCVFTLLTVLFCSLYR